MESKEGLKQHVLDANDICIYCHQNGAIGICGGVVGVKEAYTLPELYAVMQRAIEAGYKPKVYINGELYPVEGGEHDTCR